jgi:hypothetical protein
MKKMFIIIIAIASLFATTPAYADHRGGERSQCGGYDDGNGSADCSEYGGQGNHNRRNEDYGGAGCKYVCPSFDKSPVHDAFNFSPFVCMPGATCYEDGDKRKNQDQPPSQEPTAEPNPACIISVPYHCDPKPGGE